MKLKRFYIPLGLIFMLTACTPAQSSHSITLTLSTVASTLTSTLTASVTSPPKSTATLTPSLANTLTPTTSPTFQPKQTFTVLRGVVNQEHVSCFYGPSKAYLYKYGLLKGNRLDIIGTIADTNYIEVQAIGGNNPCWMNLEWMDVQGDIHSVKPIDPLTINIPWSPYYPALNWAKATRSGNTVTIDWALLKLRAGDDSEQELFLLEAWVCRDEKLTFVPIGAYENKVMVLDEPGCNEPSFGRVYGVEKHGYTKYLKFQWPQAE